MTSETRMKHVREGERRSRRKLGLSPELKTYPFEIRRLKVLVQTRGRGTRLGGQFHDGHILRKTAQGTPGGRLSLVAGECGVGGVHPHSRGSWSPAVLSVPDLSIFSFCSSSVKLW
jgi:hypothetical protein